MSEHDPKQTPSTEPATEIMSPLTVPTESAINQRISLDFEPYTTPEERASILSDKIGADASLRGFDDLQGLDLKVEDGTGGSQRYVVVDSSVRPVYEEVEFLRPFSRPRMVKPILEARKENGVRLWHWNGLDAWSRVKEPSRYRKVGRPRLVKRGSSREIARDVELLPPVYKNFVTVEVYDKAGPDSDEWQLTGTEDQLVEEFYADAGAVLTSGGDEDKRVEHPHAEWDWTSRDTEPLDPLRRDLEIGLSRHGRLAFEDIARQLEGHGITNWGNLTWQLVVPGKAKTEGADISKKGMGVRTRIETIARDRTIREPNYNGSDIRYARQFVINTVEKYEDGSQVIVNNRILRDYELIHYLEAPDDFPGVLDGSVIWDVRMPSALPRDEAGREKEARESRQMITEGLPRIRHDRRPLEEALGMLITRGRLYGVPGSDEQKPYPSLPRDYAALSLEIALAEDNGAEKRLGKELQATLFEVGVQYFDAAVNKVHGLIYGKVKTDAERLGLKSVNPEQINTWVAKALLSRSKDARSQTSHPFTAVLQSPDLLRELTDECLGELFGLASTNTEKTTVPEGLGDDGKPKLKEKDVYEFNDALFERVPYQPIQTAFGAGSYSLTKDIRTWRDKVWAPIEKLALKAHEYNVYKADPEEYEGKKPPEAPDYKELGRRLRRTIGE